jgi:hypothetical protein
MAQIGRPHRDYLIYTPPLPRGGQPTSRTFFYTVYNTLQYTIVYEANTKYIALVRLHYVKSKLVVFLINTDFNLHHYFKPREEMLNSNLVLFSFPSLYCTSDFFLLDFASGAAS